MENYNFNVGPSQLFDSVSDHLNHALRLGYGSISHRSIEFQRIYQHTDEQLKILLNIPKDNAIFFTGSASEIFERIGQNLIEHRSAHFVNGSFSAKFYDYIQSMYLNPFKIEKSIGEGFENCDMSIPSDVDLIVMTQNETSTGVLFNESSIHQIKKENPTKIVAVDIVSSAPICALDFNVIDSAFFSVQKCFGMPAGLGVWIVNEAVIDKATRLHNIQKINSAHHTILDFYKNYKIFQTPCTPNVLFIYVLGKIAEEMNKKGVIQMRNETQLKSNIIEKVLKCSETLSHGVKNEIHRSKTVRVINVEGNNKNILAYLKSKKLEIGAGYGSHKDSQIRIGIFPAVPVEAYEILAKELELYSMS